MKSKSTTIILLTVLAIIITVFLIKKSNNNQPDVAENIKKSLPINTIAVIDRPYISLSPDSSGRNLTLYIDNLDTKDKFEYELVYAATDKQEGVFGRINFASQVLPVEKKLLLGSKSAGGAVTYHEGVTGGSITVTYDTIKLKESFNFLRFDSSDPVASSKDTRFQVEFTPTSLVKNSVIVVMKTFGLPAEVDSEILAGPYGYFTASTPKSLPEITLKLPSGDHATPTIVEYLDGEWVELETKISGDTLSAESLGGQVFIVISGS